MSSKAINREYFYANEFNLICDILFARPRQISVEIDEEKLLELIKFHRVEQRFRKKLEDKNEFSAKFIEKLNLICDQNISNGLQLTKCFFVIAKDLALLNIRIFAFKGPILSHYLHRDFTLRTYRDCDFLVEEKDLQNVIDYFEANSWEWIEAKFNGDKQRSTFFKVKNHITFTNEAGLIFEVHIVVSPFVQNKEILNSSFLKNSESVEFAGIKLQVFSKEDNFIYLCLHGIKHFFFRISWLADLIYFLDSEADKFRSEVLIRAKKCDCEFLIEEVLNLLDFYQSKKDLKTTKLNQLFFSYQKEITINIYLKKPISIAKQLKFHHGLIYYAFGWKGLIYEWRMRRNRPENWSIFVFPNHLFSLNLIFSECIYVLRKLSKN